MFKFISFGSGSSGNCYYLGTEDEAIIIDSGIGIRMLKKRMAEYGLRTSKLLGVLVTHDHFDHVKSVGLLSDAYNLPVYATEEVYQGIMRNLKMTHKVSELRKKVIEKDTTFKLGGFEITAFQLPHDSLENVGYSIKYKGEIVFSVMTDVGTVTDNVKQCIQRSNYLVFEANYDLDMLRMGRYPETLKDRIMSGTGHLSNAECADALAECWHEGLKHVWLCHLSEENNHPQIAQMAVTQRLAEVGEHVLQTTAIDVLKRTVPTGPFEIEE